MFSIFFLVFARSRIITNPKLRPFTLTESDQHQKEKEKIDEDLQQLSEGSSPEPNSNEVIIPMLKKNGPILQSQ